MSLVRLLTSGKSLIGLNSVASRYRMRSKNPLPKFGSVQNPFSTTRPEPPDSPAESGPTVTPTLAPAEVAAANLKDTAVLPPIRDIPAPPEAAPRSQPPARRDGRLQHWLRLMNPFSWWRGRDATGPRSALPGLNRLPVQGELSLDHITVVRNDLSDADVEVVPVRIAGPAAAEPATEPPAKPDATPELIKV